MSKFICWNCTSDQIVTYFTFNKLCWVCNTWYMTSRNKTTVELLPGPYDTYLNLEFTSWASMGIDGSLLMKVVYGGS